MNNRDFFNFTTVEGIDNFITYIYDSPEFKSLNDKTQVFNKLTTSKVKTRGTHSDDVSSISKALVEEVTGQKDTIESKKAQLIGLLHDIGHIPYGHAGESSASHIIESQQFTEAEKKQYFEIRKRIFGEKYAQANEKQWFEHNENSAMVYVSICGQLGIEPDFEIIEGIIAHSTSRYSDLPPTISQQAVRLADKIAYINFDIQDLYETFNELTPEYAALEELYNDRIKDPNGNVVTIDLGNGKAIDSFEFVHMSADERIELFVKEAVRLAQNNNNLITGCNDIALEIGAIKKKIKGSEDPSKLQQDIQAKQEELYKTSPLYYMAYKVKDKTDNFIRTAEGLRAEEQIKRNSSGKSAVGNEDLLNEFCYKVLSGYMYNEIMSWRNGTKNKNSRLNILPPNLREFMKDFEKFLESENKSMEFFAPGEGLSMPLMYMIVSYIGRHTNSELDLLKEELNISQVFTERVISKLTQLNNEQYINEDGKLNSEGKNFRNKIYETYGAPLTLEFGLEEENLSPLVAEETIKRLEEEGYKIGDHSSSSRTEQELSNNSNSVLANFLILATEEERQKVFEMIEEVQQKQNSGGISL